MNVRTAAVENLLRVARSEAAAGTAFAALLGGGPPQIVAVPAAGTSEGRSTDELSQLVRQAAADPEFPHTRVFVRSVQMGRPLTLAVAPLHDGIGACMIGVVAEPDRRFEPAQLELLERLAQRLLRHLQVVQHLEVGGAADQGPRPPAGGPPAAPRPAERPGPQPTGGHPAVRAPAGGVAAPGSARGAPASAIGPATPEGAEAPPVASSPEQAAAPSPQVLAETSPAMWWAGPDPLTGLSSLGQFFSRAGRMLAPDDRTTGALALVVVEVPDPRTMPTAARVLSAQLRFSDPVARVDRDLLAVAMLLLPAATGEVVEQRLALAVRAALERQGPVQAVHVVAVPGERRGVDELLQEAISHLPGRQAGGGGAPWRGAGGSAARLPIP